MPSHRVIIGDCRRALPKLPDASAHLVVTSPPYWGLKDYRHPRQIGRPESYARYQASLAAVWRECLRVLHPGCRMAVNVGDQFLRASDHGRYRVLPIAADTARACVDAGFDYMGSIIWRKRTSTRTSNGGALMGSIHFPRDGHVTFEHEYILLVKKPGKAPRPRYGSADFDASRIPREARSAWFRGDWKVAGSRQSAHTHGAVFPVEIPARLVRMYSFRGETVLDPFLGSGTTSVAAHEAGRASIGIEINPENLPVIRARLERAGVAEALHVEHRARRPGP